MCCCTYVRYSELKKFYFILPQLEKVYFTTLNGNLIFLLLNMTTDIFYDVILSSYFKSIFCLNFDVSNTVLIYKTIVISTAFVQQQALSFFKNKDFCVILKFIFKAIFKLCYKYIFKYTYILTLQMTSFTDSFNLHYITILF